MARKNTAASLTDEDYADMAADYAANPLHPEEVLGTVEVNPAVLRAGRPAGKGPAKGRTPATSVRLPEPLRRSLDARAALEAATPAEIIRRAITEYLDRHPA